MVAAATYMSYWLPQVYPLIWVALFSALLVGVNLFSVGGFGEVEYWFAMVKLVTIVAFIVIGATFLLNGRVAPQYTVHGGFFPKGVWAPGAAMSFALFTFAGIEFVAISSGESRSASEMPRAVLLTFGILTFVYLGAIAILVGVMPWNGAGVTESPFVTVFRIAGLPAASNIMNFVVLTAALSGANASLYADSRMLFSLGRGGYAPARFGRLTNAGAPLLALLASCFGIILAMIFERWAPQSAYVSLLGAALFGVMLVWLVTLAAHIAFRRKLSAAQLAALPMRPRGRAWLSAAGIVIVLASLAGTWFYSHLIVISGIVYVVVLTLFYLAMKKSRPNITISGS
jgi:L-asparagine transporter-like permease